MRLVELGWDRFFAAQPLPGGLHPARVVSEHRGGYQVTGEEAGGLAELDGALRGAPRLDRPAVGDWVGVDGAGRIRQLLERRTRLVRRAAGQAAEPQVVAANVDRVFMVTSANHDFNPRRIDRYLAAIHDGGAQAALVLNKIDLCADLAPMRAAVPPRVPVIATSAVAGEGVDDLLAWMPAGATVAFVGSSGVGKSTLVNRLLGRERQEIAEADAHDRGRHTTSRRELIALPGGALVVDTPGMRELGLWLDGAGLEAAFADVDELAAGCRFSDCRHHSEPGCAVRAAIGEGRLDAARLDSLRKLEREQEHLRRQVDAAARREAHRRVKQIHKEARRRERVPKGFR